MTKKEYYNYLTWMFETFAMTIQEENKRTGCQTRKQTLVFDMDQFSMKLLTSKPGLGKKLNKTTEFFIFIKSLKQFVVIY